MPVDFEQYQVEQAQAPQRAINLLLGLAQRRAAMTRQAEFLKGVQGQPGVTAEYTFDPATGSPVPKITQKTLTPYELAIQRGQLHARAAAQAKAEALAQSTVNPQTGQIDSGSYVQAYRDAYQRALQQYGIGATPTATLPAATPSPGAPTTPTPTASPSWLDLIASAIGVRDPSSALTPRGPMASPFRLPTAPATPGDTAFPTDLGGQVSVISPSGIRGTIPSEDLDQALAEGYQLEE